MYSVRPNLLMRKIYPSAIWRIVPLTGFSPDSPSRTDSAEQGGGDGRGGQIFLRFDDGPVPEITPWVLDTLKKYDAKATFFCVGANIEKYPSVFQKIISEGHSIGNHTHNHLNGWKAKTKNYLENIALCNSAIKNYQSSVLGNRSNNHFLPINDQRSPLFRPPYGKLKRSQYSILKSKYSLVMWDVLSGDFDQKLSEEKCLKNVLTKTREGSIVVFHDSIKAKKNLFYTLPKFLEHFSKKGFVFDCLPASP